MTPAFQRVAPGDYQTKDGDYRLYRHEGVYPPAWSIEHLEPSTGKFLFWSIVVDGAASKRDALDLLTQSLCKHPTTRLHSWRASDGTYCVGCNDCGAVLNGAA